MVEVWIGSLATHSDAPFSGALVTATFTSSLLIYFWQRGEFHP